MARAAKGFHPLWVGLFLCGPVSGRGRNGQLIWANREIVRLQE